MGGRFRTWLKAHPEFEHEARRRAKRALIVGGIAFVILAVTGAASFALIWLTAVALALYVPPWGTLRHGKWVVVLGVLALVALYPFYQANLFQMPIFGEFPTVRPPRSSAS